MGNRQSALTPERRDVAMTRSSQSAAPGKKRQVREVELITIGDELLLGFTIDTNSAFLARRLAEEGVAIARRTAVGDTKRAIVDAVREALERTNAVITTGGLGPTSDDCTREAVAEVFNVDLRVDKAHVEWMQARWKKRFGRDMPKSNQRQAMIPWGGRKLENKHGSAPGVFIEDHRGFVMMLPGVPRELMGMTEDTVLPVLREYGAGGGECIKSHTLRTTGVAESLLEDRLDAAVRAAGRDLVSVAYLPGVEGVDLRLTVRARDEVTAKEMLAKAAAAIRHEVGDSIYAEAGDDLARVVIAKCRSKNLKIAVAESCTGGGLGARLTAIPGSSEVFLGGIIAYSDDVKIRELGVSPETLARHGAVSEEVVREMALGAMTKFGAEVALAITGVAGPGGGTDEKPVGLVWLCAVVGDRVEPRKIQSWGDRQEIRYRAAQAALDLARQTLD
jgi:nicotinamide-nucleotide amidase